MAKPRFRLSDMMRSSWFHKPRRIRDNSKPLKNPQNPNSEVSNSNISPPSEPKVPNRSSYYLSSKEREDKLNKFSSDQLKKQNSKGLGTHFPSEPLVSPKLRSKAKPSKPYYAKPISSVSPKNFKIHQFESCTVTNSSKDITFDLVITSPEMNLRPILTKPTVKKKEKRKNRRRKVKLSSVSISPRCNSQRKWISESLAVVKCSTNPEKDFTESMVEMILEKNITKTEDLEELLACYLSLNSKEYHDVIVKVFEKIWLVYYQVR